MIILDKDISEHHLLVRELFLSKLILKNIYTPFTVGGAEQNSRGVGGGGGKCVSP